jgi:tRNA 2-thiouridine synthesizing protein D
MSKLTLGCFSSLVGSMSLDVAVKIAEAAIEKGHEVDFWVSGHATMVSKTNQKDFQDYSTTDPKLKELMGKGMQVTVCEACMEARGYGKEDTVEGMNRKSMDWFLASSFSADRVLHIGGE